MSKPCEVTLQSALDILEVLHTHVQHMQSPEAILNSALDCVKSVADEKVRAFTIAVVPSLFQFELCFASGHSQKSATLSLSWHSSVSKSCLSWLSRRLS